MKSIWAAAVVALGLGLGGGYWLAGGQSAPRSEAGVLHELDRLERRLASLERERSRDAQLLRAALSQAWTAALDVGAEVPEQSLAEDADDERDVDSAEDAPVTAQRQRDASAEAARARAEAMLSKYDDDSEQLPAEPTWSTPTLRAAQATIASTVPGARVLEARCGGNTCRIVVEHAPGDNAPAYSRSLLELPPFDQGSTAAFTPAEGKEPARSRVYVHRPDKVALSRE